jgi:peroxiredoxin Q/BCP
MNRMVRITHAWMGLVIVGLLIAGQGCKRANDQDDRKPKLSESKILKSGDKAGAAKTSQPQPAAKPQVEEPPPKPTIPQVGLSAELLATCVVKVGDRMPDAELPDPDGKPQSIASLKGKKLTVVFFWTADNPYSLGEVEDLNEDVARDYADKGVRLVGINHGDTSEKVRQKVKELALAFPVLMDPKNEYYAKVAREKVLRTYLLDADGKILWFDVEYSRSTHRDLLQAIDVALGKAG